MNKQGIIKQISSQEYEKYWSLNLSVLMANILGDYYANGMRKDFGIDFDNVVIISQKGYSTCYLREQDRKVFAQKRIKDILENKRGLEEFNRKIRDKIDNIYFLINKYKDNKIVYSNLYKVIKLFSRYNGLHITPRHLVDFYNLNEEYLNLLKDIRVYSENIHIDFEKFIKDVLYKNNKNKKYTKNLLLCLYKDEFFKFIKTKELPETKNLKIRYKNIAIIFSHKKNYIFTKCSDVQKIDKALLDINNTNGIRGQSACPGVVKGRVKIVLNTKNNVGFKKGDILVTGMTRPDFVPIIKKASAIITDSGGLLCHAAIIAREMKKPCIIGTKIATKILKDGDKIKVDAEKGIVTII